MWKFAKKMEEKGDLHEGGILDMLFVKVSHTNWMIVPKPSDFTLHKFCVFFLFFVISCCFLSISVTNCLFLPLL